MYVAVLCFDEYGPRALTGQYCLLLMATRVSAAYMYDNWVPLILYSDSVVVILLELMLAGTFHRRRALLTFDCLL